MADSPVQAVEKEAESPWYDSHWVSALGGGAGALAGKSALSYLSRLLPFLAPAAATIAPAAIPAALGTAVAALQANHLKNSGELARLTDNFKQLRAAGLTPTEDGTVLDEDGEVVPDKYVQLVLANQKASQPSTPIVAQTSAQTPVVSPENVKLSDEDIKSFDAEFENELAKLNNLK